MKDIMSIAEEIILAPAGLTENDLDKVFAELQFEGIDFSDLYFQSSRLESWSLEDSIIKGGSYSIEQGFGIRAV